MIWDRPELLALRRRRRAPTDRASTSATPTCAPDGVRFRWRDQEVRLAVPGAHNALNAAAALEACLLAGARPGRRAAALADFQGAGRRFEHVGRTASGAEVYDDYAHHPTEVRATIEAARTLRPRAGDRRVPAAPLLPHRDARTATSARRWRWPTYVAVLDVYRARERPEDHPGVTGKLVADAAADQAGGRPRGLAADAGRRGARAARGGWGRATSSSPSAPATSTRSGERWWPHERCRRAIERDYPLARLTTVRTGGPAEFFARVRRGALGDLLAWARREGHEVGVVGSGSNLLIADAGVRGLVIKLDGELATIEQDGTRLRCGGGARLPAASAWPPAPGSPASSSA